MVGRYVLIRLLQGIVTMAVLLIIVFVVTRVSGDPVLLMLPLGSSQEQHDAVSRAMGFDRPLIEQLFEFMGAAFMGDFGVSIRQGVPALPLVIERLGPTLLLTAAVFFISIALAVPLGVLAAARPRGLLDRLISAVSLTGNSVPEFWLALMLTIVFAVNLGWLPTSGYGGWAFLILPAAALLPRRVGRVAQILRTNLIEILGRQYVTTAHSKGLRPSRVLLSHALPNAAIPALTVAGDEIATLLSGAVVIEIVFAWPGVGYQAYQAIQQRDLPVVEATVFVVGALVLLVNLAVDLSYAMIDPRIRYR